MMGHHFPCNRNLRRIPSCPSASYSSFPSGQAGRMEEFWLLAVIKPKEIS